MAGKKFKFRTDANRRPGIKEVINRGMSVRGQRVSISVGLDKDFNLSRKHIIADNIFVPIKDTKGLKKGKGGKAVYYPFVEISYIATITLQYNKNKKIAEKTLILYEPNGLCSSDEIYCTRVTGSLSLEEKKEIVDKLLGYINSRI